MGRNPVVGRQGPGHRAAVIPTEDKASVLTVKQVRSGIGHADTMRRTLRALGLQHHQQSVQLPNNSSVRGMLIKVRHLIEVTPAKES
ncbi:MAG TPA: 50S ribosomal protein L30 [Gemmatimonadales bacterium]